MTRRVRLLIVCALLAGLAMTGCRAKAPAQPEATTKAVPADSAVATMPDLRGRPMEQAWRLLAGETTTVVTFPGEVATRAVEATRIAGALVPAHVETITVPGRVMLLTEMTPGPDGQRVVGQRPPPGTPRSRITTVTLTATRPHPRMKGPSYIFTHGQDVAKEGAIPCLTGCHDPEDCNHCHVKYVR